MSRAERWWRPAPRRNVRPAVRSARRGRYAADGQAVSGFEVGYEAGRADEAKRSEQRDEQIRRLVEACDAAEQGDPSLLDEIGRQAAADDLLDVADAAGATPLVEVDGGQLVDELEAWLAEQGGGQ